VTVPSDPRALLRSRSYLRLLLIAAVLGVPVSAAAYGFLALVNYLQPEIFTHLPLVAGVAMGIGAMSAVMLNLPLTSVLLATLLLASDGLAVMPLVIVAVVVAYVASARIAPAAPAETRNPPAAARDAASLATTAGPIAAADPSVPPHS
jgi:hypothetical protein